MHLSYAYQLKNQVSKSSFHGIFSIDSALVDKNQEQA